MNWPSASRGGDLSRDVQVTSSDEVGKWRARCPACRTRCAGWCRQVQEAASNSSTARSEIATGNHDLSQRTSRLQPTWRRPPRSMEVLTGTIQQSAQSSRQASDFASSAAQVAARGGAVVSQVVTTMDDITASSRKIADITGVIDSDCLPDQHPGAQRGRGSRPRGRARPGLCRGGQRGAQPGRSAAPKRPRKSRA